MQNMNVTHNHKPSKRKKIIFFAVTALLAAAVIIAAVYIFNSPNVHICTPDCVH